jgi:S1-C subfamily serine protease
MVRVEREPLDPNMPGVTEGDLKSEQHEVDSAMRERLGDDDYDAGRFATGQNNRVEILGDLKGTVHDSAGLQPGDLVIEFDGVPIYTPEEYLEFWHSNQSAGGGVVTLTIEREGGLFTVAVPAGDHLGPVRGVSLPPE